MSVLGVFSIKGGVGKTAAAVNLAHLAATTRQRALLWDLDPQSASSYYFRVEKRHKGGIKSILAKAIDVEERISRTDYDNLDLLHADSSYRKLDQVLSSMKKPKRGIDRALSTVKGSYRHILLDCPPGLSLLAENVLRAADAVVIPVIPTPLSIRTLDQLVEYCQAKNLRVHLLPFFSMVDKRKKLHLELMEELSARRDFLRTAIPYASVVEQMGIKRAPVATFAGWTPAAEAYGQLWREIQGKLRRKL